MDISITCTPSDHIRLFVNARLVAEIAVTACDTRDTLEQELRAARASRALVPLLHGLLAEWDRVQIRGDHALKPGVEQEAAFWRGLVAGLRGDVTPHPLPGVPPILPESTITYQAGYEQGEGLRRAVQVARGGPMGP